MAGYLYLFFEDYMAESGVSKPYDVVNKAKNKIRENAKIKLINYRIASSEVENEFNNLYAIQNYQFANLGQQQQTAWQNINLELDNIEQALTTLNQIVKDQSNVATAIQLANTAIQDIDSVLQRGASTGALGLSAYNEIKMGREKMGRALTHLHHVQHGADWNESFFEYTDSKGKIKHETLLTNLGWCIKNVGGYGLELAQVYAFFIGNKQGLQQMIDIGGHGEDLKNMSVILDPKLREDLETVSTVLSTNQGVQSKADVLFNLHTTDSGGNLTAQVNWVGFQSKAFNQNTLNKGLILKYSLADADILNYYTPDFLVNVTGSVAGNRFSSKVINKSMRRHSEDTYTQGYVNGLWTNIKNSTKTMGAAAAIAGNIMNNFTNRIHFYVIKNKTTGEIRVIPVSTLLREVFLKICNQKSFDDDIAVGLRTNDSRKQFQEINEKYFSDNPDTEKAAQDRSAKAYGEILNKILTTKVQIVLNISQYF